jgi:hypothetical protein
VSDPVDPRSLRDLGLREERRNWLFLRVAGAARMIVLQEHDSEFPSYHVALTVNESDLERAAAVLCTMIGSTPDGTVPY